MRAGLRGFCLCAAAVASFGAVAQAAKEYPPDERPMYGGTPPTEPDEDSVDVCKKAAGRKPDAAALSAGCATTGFQAFREGDFRRAIHLFNTAWLLNRDNGNAYHGFALILTERDENDVDAEWMFKQAIALPSSTSGAYFDYARFLILYDREADAIPVLEAGLAKADKKGKANLQFALVTSYEQLREYGKACGLAREIGDDLKGDQQKAVREFVRGPHCQPS
jgi:predicted Zn-dependent protease